MVIAVAIYSIPTLAMVAESEAALQICITMTTFPVGATLATEVQLSLSTLNGTGKFIKGRVHLYISFTV